MDEIDDELRSVRARILLPWQVYRDTTAWAPWGKSGWSAIRIKTTSRKWASGIRVKPHNNKDSGKGRVRIDRLVKRDPELKGKDRPAFTPEETFAVLNKQEAKEKSEKKKVKQAQQVVEIKSEPIVEEKRVVRPPRSKNKTDRNIERLFASLKDDTTSDDW